MINAVWRTYLNRTLPSMLQIFWYYRFHYFINISIFPSNTCKCYYTELKIVNQNHYTCLFICIIVCMYLNIYHTYYNYSNLNNFSDKQINDRSSFCVLLHQSPKNHLRSVYSYWWLIEQRNQGFFRLLSIN